ncbi:TadE family type IV pilus minor pilin [Cellulosimicrobium marinum]|uniref:TadE family type IV pilus minor pilin n=1 Tax=Cellulosimicrobium marinum TaxID=1638992 RepID=UPI001E47BF6B|nr:TadE family type IV pilus minor pilin [Cellulosimicrobium marinum]MCB7135254.1 pilus assembly protein TadE [Cellulosimicrobium marinum]
MSVWRERARRRARSDHRPGTRRRATSERGAVTAELAVALPAVVLVLAGVLAVSAASGAQMRSADAARAGARAAAIGEEDAVVRATAEHVAGDGTLVVVHRDDPWVEVSVTSPVVTGWLSSSPLRASGQAVARVEP